MVDRVTHGTSVMSKRLPRISRPHSRGPMSWHISRLRKVQPRCDTRAHLIAHDKYLQRAHAQRQYICTNMRKNAPRAQLRLLLLFATVQCLVFALPLRSRESTNNAFNAHTYASDQAADSEVKRISSLTQSKSPVLNEAEREEIQSTITAYNAQLQQLSALSQLQVSKVAADVRENLKKEFPALSAGVVANCKEEDVTKARQSIAGSFNYILEQLEPVQSQNLPPEDSNPFRAEPLKLLIVTNTEFCQRFKTAPEIATFSSDVYKVLDSVLAQLQAAQATAKSMAERIPKITEAWASFRDKLEKAIEESASPATRVADQLWLIIGVFCVFAIAIFSAVNVFAADIQVELVASGQVIQFATVMVILIVVCVLGISGILHENTLGTLLGAVGGYVLSQGVGRAASRAATQAARDSVKQ